MRLKRCIQCMNYLKFMNFKNRKMEKPFEIYEYETKRIKKYIDEFYDEINKLNVDTQTENKLLKLFVWYGNARAIKSKAYQEMKQLKK